MPSKGKKQEISSDFQIRIFRIFSIVKNAQRLSNKINFATNVPQSYPHGKEPEKPIK